MTSSPVRNLLSLMVTSLLLSSSSYSSNNNKEIYLTVSLFWEGSHIHDHNIETINAIRKEHPQIRFHHFVNPAYFAKGNFDSQKIKSTFMDGDQLGIYVSPWKSIVHQAEILFRTSPSFWGPREDYCSKDCGNSVPLSVYDQKDIAKIFSTSRNLLDKAGLKAGPSFAISGWQNSDDISEIAERFGYKFNFSAIPPSRINRRLHHFPIYNWTKSNWEVIEGKNQALISKNQNLIIIPQNGGVADYNTSKELIQFFHEVERQKNQNATIFNLAIHQETISTFQSRIVDSLREIKTLANSTNTTLTFDWPSYRNKIQPH